MGDLCQDASSPWSASSASTLDLSDALRLCAQKPKPPRCSLFRSVRKFSDDRRTSRSQRICDGVGEGTGRSVTSQYG